MSFENDIPRIMMVFIRMI